MKYDNAKFAELLTKYNITGNNLKEQFTNILLHEKVEEIFATLSKEKLLEGLLPEFLPCINLNQKNIHHSHTVDIHILKAVQGIAQNNELAQNKELLLWTMLLHDIGKPLALKKNLKKYKKYTFRNHADYSAKIARKVLKRFGIKGAAKKTIITLVKHHEFFRYIKLYNMYTEGNRLNIPHVFKLINKIGVDNFELLLACHKADFEAQSLYWKEHKNTLNIRARDMLAYYKKLKNARMKVDFH